jgi:hypothetical protein
MSEVGALALLLVVLLAGCQGLSIAAHTDVSIVRACPEAP